MKNYIKTIILWIACVAFDQIVKLWVLATLKDKEPIVLIRNVFEFRYIENRGAAFGILQNQQIFFLIITVLVLIGIIYVYRKLPDEKRFFWLRLCCFFISAGAIGNMIDRLFRKYVVDFIYFKLIDFPVFNVADIYVTCSAIFLILLILLYYKEDELDQIFGNKKKAQDS